MTKHILVIPSWYSSGRGPGGGYFRDQALALQAAGFRVAILAPDIHTLRDRRAGRLARGLRPGAITIENDGLPVYRRNRLTVMPRLPYRNPLAWTRCGLALARRYIAENGRPDLVHAHSCLNAGVLALALNRRYGIPYVLTEHSAGGGWRRRWERDLMRRVTRRARRCLAVSPYLADLLERQYPAAWRYLPNVLGAAFIAPEPAACHSMPPFVFLCVARLSPEKGHALLFEAFAAAFTGAEDVRLRLVGDGPELPALQRLAGRLGIAAQIDFAGALPPEKVRTAMAASDAFILASTSETFGVVVIEALACGLPVVVTASGGPNHLVDPANGLLVPGGNPEALRAALVEMRRRAAYYDRAAIRGEAIGRYGPASFARDFAALTA